MNTPRRMAQLHARVVAMLAVVHELLRGSDDRDGGLVVELSLYEHMLLLSLVEAFEAGRGRRVAKLWAALPDWLGEILDRAHEAGQIGAVVRDVRFRALEIGAQIGGAA